ncbi:TetR/AcrR family transcriptional regulator [Cryptosporangium phraense]|uniref:TetR/AcrR family transcriptional regulator n=1 Tax=Cryptosporangium phraense TaxID=2593070 RepID=A0A545AI34_9ACTN|nr:TetR/AcrR family transcriptional regulator [Cryptosporangium phraense]TQS40978.1 TetR/AcrR family transcriptional regulator [Cryptosporangium phraense]
MSSETRDAIIEAAARILREEGPRGVTTRAVAQAAGVQAPTIYRLFGDKDGLVEAVAEHVMSTYVASKSVSVDEDPVVDLRAGWRVNTEFGLANPGLFTLLFNPERTSPAVAAGSAVLRRRVHRLAQAGLLRVDEERAFQMIQAAGVGSILTLLSMPAEGRSLDLADAMFDAVCASILGSAPVTPEGDVSAVAVTFGTVIDDLPALTDAERALMAEWVGRSLSHT